MKSLRSSSPAREPPDLRRDLRRDHSRVATEIGELPNEKPLAPSERGG